MDDEKKQKQGQDGFAKKTGDKLKKGAKDQAKKAMKEVFKKILKMLAPILLKLFIILVIVIIIVELFAWIINIFRSEKSKDAAVVGYAYTSGTGEGGETSIIGYGAEGENAKKISQVVIDTKNAENGAYKLTFKFYDEDENEVEEATALEKLKKELDAQKIDYSDMSETQLKIIAVLMYNGLKVEYYTSAELQSLTVFIKTDIASNSFDLRQGEDQNEEVNLEDMLNGDFVYGTLHVTRTQIDENTNQYLEPQLLDYLPYGDEATEGTYKYLEASNNISEIINHFSIDDKGDLVIPKWNTSITEVFYLDEDGNELSDEQVENIPAENRAEASSRDNVYSEHIAYRSNIKKYVLNYGFLSDLLITTQNPQFCIDIANMVFNSKIIINTKEELIHTETTNLNTYHDTTLEIYQAQFSVDGETTTTSNAGYARIKTGNQPPLAESVGYGWNLERNSSVSGRTRTYTWTYGGNEYRLTVNLNNGHWELYENKVTTSTTQSHIADGNEPIIEGEIDGQNYTTKNEWTYQVKTETNSKRNTYKFEISEMDCWFLKYKKEYNDPVEPKVIPTSTGPDTQEGTYQLTGLWTEMTNADAINSNEYAQHFITAKEDLYKDRADTVKCTINRLIIPTKFKEDITTQMNSTRTEYKFGEEKPETTEVTLKNIQMVDDRSEYVDEEGTESFLSLYNKYLKDGEDLYLEEDAEKTLFNMLEENTSTQQYSDIIRYLLYAYDEIDRGVTELNTSVLKPAEFKKAGFGGNAIAEILKCYENETLRQYMNGGNDYASVSKYVTEDRAYYKMYAITSDNTLDFSYGVMVYLNSSGPLNPGGALNNEAEFEAQGEDLKALVDQFIAGEGKTEVLVPVEKIDAIFLNIINTKKEKIKKHFEDNGISLKRNELDALVNISYQWGNFGESNNIASVYKQYILDPETPDYEGFFQNAYVSSDSGPVRAFLYGVPQIRADNNRILFEEGRYLLADGTEINGNSQVADFAFGLVGEDHERFTGYKPTNGINKDMFSGNDWCAMFVSYCYNECGLIPSVIPDAFCGCTDEVEMAQKAGIFIDSFENPEYVPEPGDIIFFTKDNRVHSYHTGIVYKSDGTKVSTVEGNTEGTAGWTTSKVSYYENRAQLNDHDFIYGYIPVNR